MEKERVKLLSVQNSDHFWLFLVWMLNGLKHERTHLPQLKFKYPAFQNINVL